MREVAEEDEEEKDDYMNDKDKLNYDKKKQINDVAT